MRLRSARLGFLFFLIVLFGLASFTWYWMTQPGNLPIKNVRVVGQLHFVTPAQVQKIVMPYVSQGFFNVKVAALQKRINALQGIKKVEVTRTFPSTITLQITEKRPVGVYQQKLVDALGYVFSPKVHVSFDALPRFQGQKTQLPEIVSNYESWSKVLVTQQLEIASLSKNKGGQWKIVLAGGAKLYLGSIEMKARLSRFVASYHNLLATNPKKKLVSVDLRYAQGFAARWG